MGLDIEAVSHLSYVCPIPSDEEWDRMERELSAQGKDFDGVYFFLYDNRGHHKPRLGGMKPGLYATTERSETHGFRAGSYIGYNWWRQHLCLFAHGVESQEVWDHPLLRGNAFVELIDFSDCEGRIGSTVAAKLARDFRDHAKRAADFASTLQPAESAAYWLEVYQDFTRAFELAGQDGALRFC